MKKFKIGLFPLVLLFLTACEKDINLDVKAAEPLLVVDAQIENGQPPIVVLTKSLGYFSKIDPQILANSFVRNAKVYVSNGVQTHQLKEYATPLAPGYTAYFYSNDLTSPSTAFVGEYTKTYSLRIEVDNKVYTATTFIPNNNITLDSIFTRRPPFVVDTTLRTLQLRSTDPAGLGNFGRYFTKKNSGPFLPGENSVFDDQIIDGTTFTVQLPQGIDRNNPPKADSNFFKRGDTITLKYCNIPQSTFTFWSTWEFAFQGIGNPFAQPNKVLGNISNGALGAFCGYGVQYKTIIAP
ncbi:DUF4249 family protein [Ferruginibacter yonginensis]|uniref:DUF4249 family protein n=1 Tax=Ferruginibacter yonginensis TaxID=1310416 RepID=A0ABV8QN79_9BACT